MKFKLQTYVRSVAVLLALTLLFSLVFAALYYFPCSIDFDFSHFELDRRYHCLWSRRSIAGHWRK